MRSGAPGKQSASTRVLLRLVSKGPATVEELSPEMGVSPKSLRDALRRLLAVGAVTSEGLTRKTWTAVPGARTKYHERVEGDNEVLVEVAKPAMPKRQWFEI